MFEPVRGGTRGGQAEFKWSDVSADKDRENYLGHSINAPTGRWQKNKDVHWYSRDKNAGDAEAMREEIRKIKEQEAEALSAALGFAPGAKTGGSNVTGGSATGANAIAVPNSAGPSTDHDAKKEEKRKRKEERREEKRLKKERRRAEKEEGKRHHRSDSRSRSRSRSPPRHRDERSRNRHRSRSPPPRRDKDQAHYDEGQREREREWARRQWDDNARREQPSGARSWGRN